MVAAGSGGGRGWIAVDDLQIAPLPEPPAVPPPIRAAGAGARAVDGNLEAAWQARPGQALILDLDVVTALGIVVAELVTNCYDHAFPAGKGSIVVSLRRAAGDDDVAIMTIRDNGKGFTPVARSKRQGVGLVQRLIEQVRGTAVIETDHGTAWIISFPVA